MICRLFSHICFLDDKYLLFIICRKLESYKYPTGDTFTKEERREEVCNKLHMSLEYQKKVYVATGINRGVARYTSGA